MNSSDASFKYARPLVALHWLMFLLFIVVYAAMEFRVIYDKGMLLESPPISVPATPQQTPAGKYDRAILPFPPVDTAE